MFVVIVCGSRGFWSVAPIADYLSELKDRYGDSLVVRHGGAGGVDSIAHGVCGLLGIATDVMPADWARFGKGAGQQRNLAMLRGSAEYGPADAVIGFWDGQSRGTRHMMDAALHAGLPVAVVRESGERFYRTPSVAA